MCGISGQYSLNNQEINQLKNKLIMMSRILEHRGPDGNGIWMSERKNIGFMHRRLSIIDISENASQPMKSIDKNVITYNGEIYNYLELKSTLSNYWEFKSKSDTEVILAAYSYYGFECLKYLRGMFSFALYDHEKDLLFCARDRFGIKPFYYSHKNNEFIFASEPKAILPFLGQIKTNKQALAEYFTFQFNLGKGTLFDSIYQLLPGHFITIKNGNFCIEKYWDIKYDIDYSLKEEDCIDKLNYLINDSVKLHSRSDVPIGCYVSGGIDSSLIYILNKENPSSSNKAFHGKFSDFKDHDESFYANEAVRHINGELLCKDISFKDFENNLLKMIYYLDYPCAGPGSFPQYMVAKLASRHVKVVLGGQGGDEIFGGYARYLLAYLEQCLKAAIDGTYKNGNFVVTLESIIPNLGLLREYKPMIKSFWKNGLFESMGSRYFSLINRATETSDIFNWDILESCSTFENFKNIFENNENFNKESYFDKMTHFDFKTLLPALLQVEDRMSMAHGIETRIPFLDNKIVDYAATIPADIKFKDGNMKYLLKKTFMKTIPPKIIERRDKMGFPVPLKHWFNKELKDFSNDILQKIENSDREFVKKDFRKHLNDDNYSRRTWALISLECWHQQFHDKNIKLKFKD